MHTLLQLYRGRCSCNPYTISDVLYTDVYPTSWRQSRRQGTSSAQLAKYSWEISMEHHIPARWRFCLGRSLWGRSNDMKQRFIRCYIWQCFEITCIVFPWSFEAQWMISTVYVVGVGPVGVDRWTVCRAGRVASLAGGHHRLCHHCVPYRNH